MLLVNIEAYFLNIYDQLDLNMKVNDTPPETLSSYSFFEWCVSTQFFMDNL